jgi:hypothetical protein
LLPTKASVRGSWRKYLLQKWIEFFRCGGPESAPVHPLILPAVAAPDRAHLRAAIRGRISPRFHLALNQTSLQFPVR